MRRRKADEATEPARGLSAILTQNQVTSIRAPPPQAYGYGLAPEADAQNETDEGHEPRGSIFRRDRVLLFSRPTVTASVVPGNWMSCTTYSSPEPDARLTAADRLIAADSFSFIPLPH